MSLLQRTVRITLASLLSMITAMYFGLENPMAAGIIALLSLLDTRMETIQTGFRRIFSTILAFLIATLVFLTFGFSVYSFGIYLAIYVPLAHLTNLQAGIPPCSVLVTHFVIAESVSWQWQLNGMSLMTIGVIFALLFSSFLPSYDDKLELEIAKIEEKMSEILFMIDEYLTTNEVSLETVNRNLTELSIMITELEQLAQIEYENNYFSQSTKDYYVRYAIMREQQCELLSQMVSRLSDILLHTEENELLASIFSETAEQLDERNPGTELLNSIQELYEIFRNSELPETRAEFENRAILYSVLLDFEKFLNLKSEFYVDYGKGQEEAEY